MLTYLGGFLIILASFIIGRIANSIKNIEFIDENQGNDEKDR